MAETVTQTRAKLAEALSHDLRQLGLDIGAAFVESQQREIERLVGGLELIAKPSPGMVGEHLVGIAQGVLAVCAAQSPQGGS